MSYEKSSFSDLNEEDYYPYCPNWKEAHYNIARLGPRYYPVDLFKKFDNHRKPTEKYFWGCFTPAALGFGAACLQQLNYGRPAFSQFHKHIYATAVGLITGYLFVTFAVRRSAREQSRLYHYVESHPEYFPLIERYKVKDTLGEYRLRRVWR